MSSIQPRLIQTYLLDGTIEGVRIIDCESTIKAFVIPRIKINEVKSRQELSWPSLYILISKDTNQAYIGESENFYHRIKNHDQKKQWWDTAIAVVSTTNELEKSDVKYLESLAIERAQDSSMKVQNKTAPIRNNIHEFKLHKLQKIIDDIQLILISLGYNIFSSPKSKTEDFWFCDSKKTHAKAVFKGDKFIVLAKSVLDKTDAASWRKNSPSEVVEREELFAKNEDLGDIVRLKENVEFKSPNHAGSIVTGRRLNAWTTWKNEAGQTMDEVMRRGE